jgi:hypothetical protein
MAQAVPLLILASAGSFCSPSAEEVAEYQEAMAKGLRGLKLRWYVFEWQAARAVA